MSGLVEAFEDNVGTGGEITGSGTANTLAMFTGTQTIGNSVVTQQPNGLDPTVTDVLVAGNFMPSTTAIYTCGATGNFWANVYTNSVTGSATGLAFAGTAATSGAITAFTYTVPANTGQAASAEIPSEKYNGGSRQWATGAITTQRERWQTTTTYTAVGASTISQAYGMYIEAPTASTNVTITNNFALGLTVGTATFKFGNQTTTSNTSAIYFCQTTPSVSNYGIYGDASTTILNSTTTTSLSVSNTAILAIISTRAFFTPSAASTGNINHFLVNMPNDTNQTASSNISSFKITGGSRQWATGAITTQYENYFSATTYTAVGASTISQAYGMYIESPTASTNITITNNFALGLATTSSTFKFGDQAASTPAIWMAQATPSSANYALRASATTTTVNGNNQVTINGNNVTLANFNNNSGVTQFTFTPTSQTANTASTEFVNFKYTGVSRQWSTGALNLEREWYISAPTYSFVGASTLTNAYSFFVERAIAGTNATITNAYAIGTDGNIIVNNTFGQSANIVANRASNALSALTAFSTNGTFAWATGLYSGTSSENYCILDSVANVVRMQMTAGGSSGALTGWRYSPASNSGQTASTEIQSELWDSFTRTWATGAITTQRDTYYKTVTYAFGGASTITNAYRLYVEVATVGSNATITNNWALGLNGGIFLNGTANTVLGSAALATNATTGFLHVPSCAGTPTGTPTLYTGMIPVCADSTNNKLYIYSGGAWVALN